MPDASCGINPLDPMYSMVQSPQPYRRVVDVDSPAMIQQYMYTQTMEEKSRVGASSSRMSGGGFSDSVSIDSISLEPIVWARGRDVVKD